MTARAWLLAINVLGGAAILGSYAHGILTHDAPGRALWGGLSPSLRPLYQASMLAATAGYLCVAWFLLRELPVESARIFDRWSWRALVPIHVAYLVPSALWMPLTFRYLAAPSDAAWALVRVVLATVGLAAVALVAALVAIEPRAGRVAWGLAVAGACAFAFQTAVLDALVWPARFRGAR